ncbi:MAG: potassium transporter TrkH [Clostridia bacterium]|nr:potassium transporter TrkH [Clostridia bacterium]
MKNTRARFGRVLSPVHLIPLSFLAAILVGTALLWLPISTAPGQHTGPLTALFTATTSVCVTGLVVVDTYIHWSLFGKVVILLLIQLGGLGVITVFSTLLLLLGRKFTLSDRTLLSETFNLNTRSGLIRFLRRVVTGTFLIEGIGAALYSIRFIPRYGAARGIWYAVFHAVSAFCNAGLDILGPDSLCGYSSDAFFLLVTMALIVSGGLGYVVWFDLTDSLRALLHPKDRRRGRLRLTEHTKLVLRLTAVMIFCGAFLFFLTERRNPATIGAMPTGEAILNCLFQSVTLRTAGFSTFPQQSLGEISCLIGDVWMFIGGSPIGTAGGVKTVTVFIVFWNAVYYIGHRRSTAIFRRKISEEMVRKAAAIVVISALSTILMSVLLCVVSGAPLQDALYEMFSALATVGLSRALTPTLSGASRLLVVTGMYLGRIGPISMAIFFANVRSKGRGMEYAEGRFYVG